MPQRVVVATETLRRLLVGGGIEAIPDRVIDVAARVLSGGDVRVLLEVIGGSARVALSDGPVRLCVVSDMVAGLDDSEVVEAACLTTGAQERLAVTYLDEERRVEAAELDAALAVFGVN